MEIVVKVNQQSSSNIAWGLLNICSNTMNIHFQKMNICNTVFTINDCCICSKLELLFRQKQCYRQLIPGGREGV